MAGSSSPARSQSHRSDSALPTRSAFLTPLQLEFGASRANLVCKTRANAAAKVANKLDG
jgi:hypothetical protein